MADMVKPSPGIAVNCIGTPFGGNLEDYNQEGRKPQRHKERKEFKNPSLCPLCLCGFLRPLLGRDNPKYGQICCSPFQFSELKLKYLSILHSVGAGTPFGRKAVEIDLRRYLCRDCFRMYAMVCG